METSDNTPDLNSLKFKVLREDLHRRYDHALPAEQVDEILDGLIAEHSEAANVQTFVPIIVEREATEAIESRAWAEGSDSRRRELLFVCQHNTGRSQIASIVARELAGDALLIRSVGPEPQSIGNEEIVRQLQERGYDASTIYPKELTSRTIYESDIVVLIGGEELADYRDNATEEWDIADPEVMDAGGVGEVIDDITRRVSDLLERNQALAASE